MISYRTKLTGSRDTDAAEAGQDLGRDGLYDTRALLCRLYHHPGDRNTARKVDWDGRPTNHSVSQAVTDKKEHVFVPFLSFSPLPPLLLQTLLL